MFNQFISSFAMYAVHLFVFLILYLCLNVFVMNLCTMHCLFAQCQREKNVTFWVIASLGYNDYVQSIYVFSKMIMHHVGGKNKCIHIE